MVSNFEAQRFAAALTSKKVGHLRLLADNCIGKRPGIRLQGNPDVISVSNGSGALCQIAQSLLGPKAQPVRAVLFDKTAANNWAVPWHQDRTIAVRERRDVVGFGPWSRKSGAWHVEPPFEITAHMATLRAHLDDCDEDNAPLLYIPSSHRAGKLAAESVAAFARERDHAVSLARSGDVWAYATAVVHGSEAARKPARRRVLQVDYSADELPGGLEWMGI